MNDKERRIVEQRTHEAHKERLMGWNGKIGVVLRNLGELIYEQNTGIGSEGGRSSTNLEDYMDDWLYEDEENYVDRIDTMEALDELGDPIESPWGNEKKRINYDIAPIGYYYQLMQNGLNLEMKFINETKEMIVNYQGYLVFKEKQGELLAFVPNKEWQEPLEKLYKKALKKEEAGKEEVKQTKISTAKKEKENWLNDMKRFWGFE